MKLQVKIHAQKLLLFAAILLAAAVIYTSAPLGRYPINNETNTVFENNWQYRLPDGTFSDVILPHNGDTPSGSTAILKNQLPNELVKGATVLLRTSQQNIEVRIDGLIIYSSYDRTAMTQSPSSAYHFARLPADCAGKSIEVALNSPYKNYSGTMNQIYIGSKASNVFFIIHENSMRFVIGFLIFSIGFLLIIMFSFVKDRENKVPLIDLGAFFICAGYWLMEESKMLQFILPYPVVLTNLGVFALTLLPLFSCLYYYKTHPEYYKKLGRYMLSISASASLLLVALAITVPRLPLHIFPFYLVFIGIHWLVLFISILTDSIRAGSIRSAPLVGMSIFGICALLELIFYLLDKKKYNHPDFLTIGLILFCISMGANSVKTFTQVYRAAVKVDALSVLVYMDSLTGLKNRTAFLEDIAKIEINEETDVTLAMYDVNNLKMINDTLGHLAGDSLLRHSAKAIKTSLYHEDEVYRIGGDEFIAILYHGRDFDGRSPEERLLAVINKENHKTLSYTLSIAYGFATFSGDKDNTLFETQARADEKMYACKKLQKQGILKE